MEYTTLGTTDLQVSRLGMGTVELGMAYGIGLPSPPSDDECIRLLRTAFEAGITFIDTAAAYGRSEELVGRAFAGLASRPVISTKATLVSPDTAEPLRGHQRRQHLEASIQRSLKRLSAESLDLLQFHNVEPNWLDADLFETMDDLTRRGWIRYWGASTYGRDGPRAVCAAADRLRALQAAYNLLDRSLEAEILPACRQAGMGVIFRSVFLKGVLSDRYLRLPPNLASLGEVAAQAAQIARTAGITLPELALRFAGYSPWAQVALFGTASIQELKTNLAAFEAGPLPESVSAAVDGLEVADKRLLNPSTWGF